MLFLLSGNKRFASLMRYKLWSFFSTNANCHTCDSYDILNYQSASTKLKAFNPNLPWCFGKFVRFICILGIGDLKQVVQSPNLFVNKLESTFSPLTYDCLEELLFERIRSELRGNHTLDLEIYRNMDFVDNHL